MTSVSRTSQFTKVAKILKKHYKKVTSEADRPVLEHLLFACCLEDSHYAPAEEAYATLKHTFFDFNEIRVTSIAELSEIMAVLPNPRAAGNRLKRVLQSIFEATYEFDLEESRKKNLGPTVKWLEKLDGTTSFSVAYVVQAALGGHSIPIDSGTLELLHICDLVTDKDFKKRKVSGIERAISKANGVEFGSMLHQLGADFTANPYSPAIREILLSINPDCKERLPKRRAARVKKAEPPKADTEKSKKPGAQKKTSANDKKDAAKKKEPKATTKKAAPEKKKSAAPKGRKPATAKKPTPKKAAAKKSSAAKGLSKRKPR